LALEAAKNKNAPFELVLSDVRLPDRNGYEIFRATKAIDTETPVILMTGFGYDPNHSIVRSSQEGLHCFLFKPFQAQQLLDEACKAIVTPPPAGL
jgi:DNA-binding NtrC family response regulator